jgi:predicted DNA-binding transcriptional regulator YafY
VKTAVRFALERFLAIDRAVRAGRFPNARILAEELEVSRRTILRDLAFLRERLGAPLAYDGVRRGYYYRDPSFRLPEMALTEGELVAIFLAERVLRQYRGTPYASELDRAFRKLAAALPEVVTIDLGELGRACSFRTTAGTEVEPAAFAALDAAIRGRRRLRLSYWTASRDEESEREVDPYHLACVDGQWYVIGHCHRRGDVRMFAPSRIRALSETGETFAAPDGFRVEQFLAGSFGVLRGEAGELHRVHLRFAGEAARYVRERAWHPSQVVEADDAAGLVVAFELTHLREVERWALSWGADCEVLGPAGLRDRVAAIAAAMATRYGVTPGDGQGSTSGWGRGR